MTGKESCPLCGAMPCDWVDDPHAKRADDSALLTALLVLYVEDDTDAQAVADSLDWPVAKVHDAMRRLNAGER